MATRCGTHFYRRPNQTASGCQPVEDDHPQRSRRAQPRLRLVRREGAYKTSPGRPKTARMLVSSEGAQPYLVSFWPGELKTGTEVSQLDPNTPIVGGL